MSEHVKYGPRHSKDILRKKRLEILLYVVITPAVHIMSLILYLLYRQEEGKGIIMAVCIRCPGRRERGF